MRTILAWLFPPRFSKLPYNRTELESLATPMWLKFDNHRPLDNWEYGAVQVACPPEAWRRTFSLYLNN